MALHTKCLHFTHKGKSWNCNLYTTTAEVGNNYLAVRDGGTTVYAQKTSAATSTANATAICAYKTTSDRLAFSPRNANTPAINQEVPTWSGVIGDFFGVGSSYWIKSMHCACNSSVWVAMGSDSSAFFRRSTDNGANWSASTTISGSNTGATVVDIACNTTTGTWIAINAAQYTRSTDNGATWSSWASGPLNGMTAIACCNNGYGPTWIVVNADGDIKRSVDDGATWGSTISITWDSTGHPADIANKGDNEYTWVIVGSGLFGNNGAFSYSTDNGATWSSAAIMSGWESNELAAIACDKLQGKFIAIGEGGWSSSLNGSTFSNRATNASYSAGMVTKIACNYNVWVTVGLTNQWTYSTDNGATWANTATLSDWPTLSINSVACNGSRWIISASSSSSSGRMVTSTNTIITENTIDFSLPGITASTQSYSNDSASRPGKQIACYDKTWIYIGYAGAGSYGYYSRSTDNGATWVKNIVPGWETSWRLLTCVACNGTTWIVAGTCGIITGGLGGAYSRSTDNGATWSSATTLPGWATGQNAGGIYGIACNGSVWVAVGWSSYDINGNGYASYSRSTDNGATWSSLAYFPGADSSTRPYDVACNGNTWIVATGGSVGYWRSTDNGATWSSKTTMANWTSGYLYKVVNCGSTWVAMGTDTTASASYYSISTNDGASWSNRVNWLPSFLYTTSQIPWGIASNGKVIIYMIVDVGGNTYTVTITEAGTATLQKSTMPRRAGSYVVSTLGCNGSTWLAIYSDGGNYLVRGTM